MSGAEEISRDYRPSVTDIKRLGMDMNANGENALLDSILSAKASTDFYNFNVIADEILIAFYGPQPYN